jgi:type II secretory ATPase GspE/PulE/Tfp pilus assembly ATPase PilB-like protein
MPVCLESDHAPYCAFQRLIAGRCCFCKLRRTKESHVRLHSAYPQSRKSESVGKKRQTACKRYSSENHRGATPLFSYIKLVNCELHLETVNRV